MPEYTAHEMDCYYRMDLPYKDGIFSCIPAKKEYFSPGMPSLELNDIYKTAIIQEDEEQKRQQHVATQLLNK